MRVLLIVDVQRDFCAGGTLSVPDGDAVVPVINALLHSPEFDLRIASKDWHPADHVSYFDNHPGRQVFESIEIGSHTQTLWPRHCEQGTLGAELHPELDSKTIDHIIHKGTAPLVDSYSAFFDNNRAQETGLKALLERVASARGVSLSAVTLVVSGLALDYCVAATVRDAVSLGIQCELVVDATRAVNLSPGDDIKVLRELASLGVKLVDSRARQVGLNRAASITLSA